MSLFSAINSSKKPSSQRKIALNWLYSFLALHKREILFLAFFSLITTALVVSVPYLSKLIIDKGLLEKNFDALILYSCGLFFIGILSTLLSGYNRIKHTQLSGKILFALREDVFQHLQKLPSTFYHQQRVGDISSRMDRDIAEIQRFAVDTLFSTFSAILGLTAATVMMIHLQWKLSLILLILIPFQLFYLFKMRPKVEKKNINVRESAADISSFFAEKIPVIKFIQSAGAEKQELDKLSHLNHHFLGKLISLQITEFWTSAIPSTLVSLSRAAIFLIGGYWVIEGSFTLGSLIAFTAYVAMAIGPLQSLLGLYLAWQRLTISLDRVSYLRQQPLAQSETELNELPEKLDGNICLNALCFSHTSETEIFNKVNLQIPAGSKVGIVGQTGIGKSTLLDLLQCHLLPSSGSIEIDGINLANINRQNWRKRIAIAPQDPVIFRDSLANNIRYGHPQATDEDVYNAAISAGLESLVLKMPNGVDTIISERGTALSGGEKQRIGLARVLLKDPVLLILDEPTSATDKVTENQIIEQIDRLFANTTRLIVSHSGKPIADADMIIKITHSTLNVISAEEYNA
jgi:ATP-binding cassette subfamily B protein